MGLAEKFNLEQFQKFRPDFLPPRFFRAPREERPQQRERRLSEIERKREIRANDIEILFRDLGSKQGLFGAFSTEVFKKITDAEIAKHFGFKSARQMGKARIKEYREVGLAIGAVHIAHSLFSDDIFQPVIDEARKINRNLFLTFSSSRTPRSEKKDGTRARRKIAGQLAPVYLKAANGLFLHDIMHALTKGHLDGDLRASFLESGIKQDSNPQLIKEELPTYVFNIGNQILPVSALLDQNIARKKVRELRKTANALFGVSPEQKATARDRIEVFKTIAETGKPPFEKFVDLFLTDAYAFLKNAQLEAREARAKLEDPDIIGQDVQVERTVTSSVYRRVFAEIKTNLDPAVLDFLRAVYDSKNIPETLFEIFRSFEPTQDVVDNLRRKGILPSPRI